MESASSDSDDSNMDLFPSETDDTSSNADADPNVTAFDTNLPAAHNYLGNFERVSGVQYLEPNRNYELPLIIHSSLVYPGETLPMILSHHMFQTTDFNDEGLVFGLVFREMLDRASLRFFGVTCQIYEKSNDDNETISIKSRAYQRFYIKNEDFFNILSSQFTVRNRSRKATVTILPEIELSHPVFGYDSNSLSKFRRNETIRCKLFSYQSKSLMWPDFVYKMYDVTIACDKIKKFLSTLKIDTVPMDLVTMSFWFCQNAILSTECRHKAFLTNNVLERILLVCQTLQEEKFIICKSCRAKLAKIDALFPMSKEGVKTNFCNAGGYIHDTHTITNALPDAITERSNLTSEFCWFPGYMWRYVHCNNCDTHLGWKYFSRNLKPKSFLGLSGNNIFFDTISNLLEATVETDSNDEVYQF